MKESRLIMATALASASNAPPEMDVTGNYSAEMADIAAKLVVRACARSVSEECLPSTSQCWFPSRRIRSQNLLPAHALVSVASWELSANRLRGFPGFRFVCLAELSDSVLSFQQPA